jgi:hypothetical protein
MLMARLEAGVPAVLLALVRSLSLQCPVAHLPPRTRSGRRATLCLELSPHELLSVEACGNGSGFLHREPEPEVAHFRTHFRLTSWKTPLGCRWPRASSSSGSWA